MIPRTFIRTTTLAVGAIVALCGIAHAQQSTAVLTTAAVPEVVTEAVKLRFLKPSEFVRFLMRPIDGGKPGADNRSFVTGFKQFVPNDVNSTVTVSGSADKLQEYKALVAFMDVAPRTLRMKIRLLRYEFAADAKLSDEPKTTEVASTEADAINNTPVELSLVAGEAMFYGNIVPHVNGDGSVSLGTKMRITHEAEDIDWKNIATSYRIVKTGERFMFVDRGADGAKVVSMHDSFYNRLEGVNTGYYLEVTPLVNPKADEKGK